MGVFFLRPRNTPPIPRHYPPPFDIGGGYFTRRRLGGGGGKGVSSRPRRVQEGPCARTPPEGTSERPRRVTKQSLGIRVLPRVPHPFPVLFPFLSRYPCWPIPIRSRFVPSFTRVRPSTDSHRTFLRTPDAPVRRSSKSRTETAAYGAPPTPPPPGLQCGTVQSQWGSPSNGSLYHSVLTAMLWPPLPHPPPLPTAVLSSPSWRTGVQSSLLHPTQDPLELARVRSSHIHRRECWIWPRRYIVDQFAGFPTIFFETNYLIILFQLMAVFRISKNNKFFYPNRSGKKTQLQINVHASYLKSLKYWHF